jgi:hypothetical protein
MLILRQQNEIINLLKEQPILLTSENSSTF